MHHANRARGWADVELVAIQLLHVSARQLVETDPPEVLMPLRGTTDDENGCVVTFSWRKQPFSREREKGFAPCLTWRTSIDELTPDELDEADSWSERDE